jgi:hypothetical protein
MTRLAVGLLLGFAIVMIRLAEGWAAEGGTLHLRCINNASGASWAIVVDLDHGLVDTLPAAVSDKWVSWNDRKQGVFDLERATGKLRFRNASSTGGYFLFYTCQAE